MKNILKKLGVLGLIVAILTPFVELPKVNAETATEGCTQHLNTYLFLDNSKLYARKYGSGSDADYKSWIEYQAETDGYTTYTGVLYDFTSAEDEKISIKSVTPYDFTTEGKITADDKASLNAFWEIITKKSDNLDYLEILEEQGGTYRFDNYSKLMKGTTYSDKEYDRVNVLFHGVWSNEEHNGIEQENVFNTFNKSTFTKTTGYNRTLQVMFNGFDNGDDSIFDNMSVSFANADHTLSSAGKHKFSTALSQYTLNGEYFQGLVEGKYDDYIYIDENLKNEPKYFTAAVTRNIDMTASKIVDELNDLTFGMELSKNNTTIEENYGKYAVFTEIPENYQSGQKITASEYNELKSAGKIKNSYSAMTNSNEGEPSTTYLIITDNFDSSDVDIDVNTSYYWPALLNVEYEVCPTSNDGTTGGNNNGSTGGNNNTTPTTGSWKLVYDDNVDDTSVLNMPNPLSNGIVLGTNGTVSSTEPNRDGYAFQGWCQGAKECSNPVKSGATITSPTKDGETITLYAQWGKTGSEQQKDTGVVSYIIGFAAVGVVAGGIYLLSKKKNLFKQI